MGKLITRVQESPVPPSNDLSLLLWIRGNRVNPSNLMGIILDLDQTLVDTRFIEPCRKKGDWATIRQLVPQITAYPRFDELIQKLNEHNVPNAIVTNSPSFYLDLILTHLGWSVRYKVYYHDIPKGYYKPQPMPIKKAVTGLLFQQYRLIH